MLHLGEKQLIPKDKHDVWASLPRDPKNDGTFRTENKGRVPGLEVGLGRYGVV